jgi:iron complex transport system substrate-binding protein
MRNRILLAAVLLAVFAGSFLAQELLDGGHPDVGPQGPVKRIVSMAPSITETLYAVGLGDRVVGVTRYCEYPPEVQELPRVGGYHDPNFEAVVALQPDLVVLLSGDKPSQVAFQKLRIPTLVVCHDNLEGILDSFVQLGRVGQVQADARQIAADIRTRLEQIRQKTAAAPRPKVLFVIERSLGSGKLEDVYVAGSDGFFDRIIELAGGRNACPPGAVRFPIVSAEGILWMDPEVVIDMTAGLAQGQPNQEAILAAWQQVAEVKAVKAGRVHAFDQDYAFVHGPRFILLVEDLARLLHPEIDWQ